MSVTDSLASQFLDLILCGALLVLYPVLYLLVGAPSLPVVVLGVLFVAFLPGYVLVSALFPRSTTDGKDTGSQGLTGTHRLVLAVGVSLVVDALVGLVLASTVGLFTRPTLVTIGVLSAVGVLVAAARRRAVSPARRFSVTVPRGRQLLTASSRAEVVVTVLIIVGVLVASGGIVYAIVVPSADESFSEFSVLTRNDSGDLVASGYPTEFVRGESQPVRISLSNREDQPTRYTTVVLLQQVDTNSGRVTSQSTLGQFEERVPPDETVVRPFEIRPERTGDRLRVQFLLYKGSPPADPTRANAYRELHLWISVQPR